MPCNSDYMYATPSEVAMSQVACLLDELDGIPLNQNHWQGYHPSVYNHHLDKFACDLMVETLCSRLQNDDVSKRSLEMQIWWRDHQRADKERIEAEVQKAKTESEKNEALAKLTDYEKKLLGLKP